MIICQKTHDGSEEMQRLADLAARRGLHYFYSERMTHVPAYMISLARHDNGERVAGTVTESDIREKPEAVVDELKRMLLSLESDAA